MKILNDLKDIESILIDFQNVLPSLRNGIVNIKEFSQKLHQNACVCAFENNDIIKGFAAYYANDKSQKIAFLSMIAVKEEYRREHIGSEILKFAELEAQSKGMHFLKLEVNRSNLGAIRFYTNHGYSVCEENPTSYYMEKELNGGE